MGDSTNRLNDKESAEFDRLYKIFCETGKWEEKPVEEEEKK